MILVADMDQLVSPIYITVLWLQCWWRNLTIFFFLNRSINVGQMVGFRLVIFVFFSDRKMWTRDNKMKMKCNIIWKVMLSTCHKLKTACWMNQLTKTQDFQEITSIERERGRERERERHLLMNDPFWDNILRECYVMTLGLRICSGEGTMGYMAPECLITIKDSKELDAFSLRVVARLLMGGE